MTVDEFRAKLKTMDPAAKAVMKKKAGIVDPENWTG